MSRPQCVASTPPALRPASRVASGVPSVMRAVRGRGRGGPRLARGSRRLGPLRRSPRASAKLLPQERVRERGLERLLLVVRRAAVTALGVLVVEDVVPLRLHLRHHLARVADRKSTRLNSSHGYISFA